MAADNTITVVGNLTRDPELRFTASGKQRASISIAVNRRWTNRQTNELEEQVSFFNVVCWADMAENVSDSLQKGHRVVVTGRLEQRNWETQDGEQRNVVEIIADEIAPSLRWATVDIHRNQRGGEGRSGGRSSNWVDESSDSAPATVSDEEPF